MMVTTGSISKLLGWGVFRVVPGGGPRAAPASCEDGNGRRKRPPGACPDARDGARAGPDGAVAGHCLRNTSRYPGARPDPISTETAMHWRVKGIIQKVLGTIPGGAMLHFHLQRRFGGLRSFERELSVKVDDWAIMARHLRNAGSTDARRVGKEWVSPCRY